MSLVWIPVVLAAIALSGISIMARLRPTAWWAPYFRSSFIPEIDLASLNRDELLRTSVTFLKLTVAALLVLFALRYFFVQIDPNYKAFGLTNLLCFIVQTLAAIWFVGFCYTLAKALLKKE